MTLNRRQRQAINTSITFAIQGLKKIGKDLALLGTQDPESYEAIEKDCAEREGVIRFRLEKLAGLHGPQ